MQYTVTMKNIKHDFPYILGSTGKKKPTTLKPFIKVQIDTLMYSYSYILSFE